MAYLAQCLAATPEPGERGGSLLDNTQVIWVNELGKGNSHTLVDLPLVLIGGGGGFQTGRAVDFQGTPHNRLWLALAHGLGHEGLATFGTKEFCAGGPLPLA